MSTAEDIEAAYGIDNHDLLPITPTASTAAADPSTTTSTTANTSTSDLASPTSPSTAPTAPSARPRIVRGRGNRLFGVLQSTLERASTDLAKDHQTIASRIQIQDRVRLQNQHAQAKLAALHSLRATRARLERDLADMNRRIVDVQMQMDMPGVHLRIEGAPRQVGRGGGAGAPYARPVIMWRPGRHNERTRRELEAQQLERKSGLEASLVVVKGRVDKVKDELAEVARREREVEMEDRSPVSPTAAAKDGVVDEQKDVEMGEAAEHKRAEPEQRAEEKIQDDKHEGDDRMDQD